MASTGFATQYRSLWESIKGDKRAPARAVGGDFETVGRLEFELLRSLGMERDWSIVDVGCGSGRLAAQLAPWLTGPYLGTDILPELLDHARELCRRPDWSFVPTNGEAIPAENGSADMVCFFSVMTHITHEETWRYLLEAKRVLRPGGRIVSSFLEFRIRSHWAIFREDVQDRAPNKILNQFLSRDGFEAFAHNAGLRVAAFHDGDTPHIPFEGTLTFENGYRMTGLGNLGQSVCVLQKPANPIPIPD